MLGSGTVAFLFLSWAVDAMCLNQETNKGSKQQKINSKEGQAMVRTYDAMARAAHSDNSPDYKTGQPAGSASLSSALSTTSAPTEAEESAKPVVATKQKDIIRLRAGMFEKNKKLLTALEHDNKEAVKVGRKTLTENREEETAFQHFFDILTVRMELLEALMGDQDHCKTFTSDTKKLNYQPVPQEQLQTTLVLNELSKLNVAILACEQKDVIEKYNTDLKNNISIHGQVRNAVKSSTRDIENAVRSKAKKAEAAAKKAALNQQKEQAKQEKLDKEKAAAAAKGKASLQSNLLLTDLKKFITPLESFEGMADFESKGQHLDGSKPFLIRNFAPLANFLSQNVPFRCQVTNFGHQFLGTQICKKTGRAQCPIMGEDLQKLVGEIFDKVGGVNGGFFFPLPDGADAQADVKTLKPVLHSALFGFDSSMEYFGLEDKALGQLRYVHSGMRKVLMVQLSDFLDYIMEATEGTTITDVLQALKNIQMQELENKKVEDKILATVQPPDSLLYVPPTWLVAEKVENGSPVIGLRKSMLSKIKPDEVAHLTKLLPDSQPLKAVANAYLSLLKGLK